MTAGRAMAAAAIAAFVLATACGKREAPENTGTATITFSGLGNPEAGGAAGEDAQAVAVSVPGFSAKLNVPGLSLGRDMNIDGIALRPGASVSGMQVAGAAGDGSGGEGHANVELRFTDPAPPAQVLGYYRQAAANAGWREVPPAAGQQFAATKAKGTGSEHLALQIGAAGSGGSTGRFLVTGS